MTLTSPGAGIRELIRELVELQDRINELRDAEQNRWVTPVERHRELVRLSHREGEVIAALRRHRLR
ncbi:hypothetical protein GCM10009740_04050 [Terrabacter terrae]|uniref:Uncharacterized protein n=1 Tax=Terrabacter terrae TaxID=318434 RepID=A0ABP5F8S1_9MICO